MKRLITIEDGSRTIYRYVEDRAPQRSELPRPYVISDIMPETEQCDGKFYTSKREFRRVGVVCELFEGSAEGSHDVARLR